MLSDGHVPEPAMYHMPATCNDLGGVVVQGDDWHVSEAVIDVSGANMY